MDDSDDDFEDLEDDDDEHSEPDVRVALHTSLYLRILIHP